MPQEKKEQREATSIKIKPQIWKDARIAAIQEGITVSELVEQAIGEWIEKRQTEDVEARKIARKYDKQKD